MKKRIFILILIALTSSVKFATSQDYQTIIIQNWSDNSWIDNYIITFTYDDNDYLIHDLTQLWDIETESWINFYDYNYINNSNGTKDTVIVLWWDINSNSWLNSEKYFYTYNISNDKVESRIKQGWGIDWYNYSKITYTYDDDDYLIHELVQLWDYETSSWINDKQTNYENNLNGTVNWSRIRNFNVDQFSWEYVSTTSPYTYSSTDKLLTSLTKDWINDSWINSSEITNTYDEDDYKINYLQQTWETGTSSWINSIQKNYTNNSNGTVYYFIKQNWDLDSTSWVNSRKYIYSYGYDNDLGVQIILSPSSGFDLAETEAVTVQIINDGTNLQSNFDVNFSIDGGTPVTETITTTLNPSDTLDYTFGTTVDFSTYDTYEIESCVLLDGDEEASNDCITKTVINDPPSYCEASTLFDEGFIAIVDCNGLYNVSDWQSGVADYTDMSVSISLGGGLPILVSYGGMTSAEYKVTVWVDWNDDYVFEIGVEGGEEFHLEWDNGPPPTYLGEIWCPPNATLGLHRMRVRTMYIEDLVASPVPCGVSDFGEVEDYTINVISAMGVEGFIASSCQVFPNPTNDKINVKSSVEVNRIQIISINGQLVFDEIVNKLDYQIDVSEFVSGMYFIKLETNKGNISKKIIVK